MNNVILWGAILVGGIIGQVLKLPGGIMVGAMVTGLALKIIMGANGEPMHWLSVVSQILVAGAIVFNSDVSTIKTLPNMIPVAIGYSIVMLLFGISVSFVLSHFFGIDILTALFASSPGGLSALGLAAIESDANAPLALMFHVTRITVVLMVVPFLAKMLTK